MAEHRRPFGEELADYLAEAVRRSVGDLTVPEEIKAQLPHLTIHKTAAYMPVSEDVLMDEGVIPDTRPPVKIRWRTRLRWRTTTARERLGLWAYWVITGDRIKTDED